MLPLSVDPTRYRHLSSSYTYQKQSSFLKYVILELHEGFSTFVSFFLLWPGSQKQITVSVSTYWDYVK